MLRLTALLLSSTTVALSAALTSPSSRSCTPTWTLDGVSEDASNEPNTHFTIRPSCNKLDAKSSHAVFVQGGPGTGPFPHLGALVNGTALTSEGISVEGLGQGEHTITVVATDEEGQSVLGNFVIRSGVASKPDSGITDNEDSSKLTSRITTPDCPQCGSCATCPGNPICQPQCQTPPPRSCAFYQTCAEAALQCGPSGYPIRYGTKNCNQFVDRIDAFTSQGQAWIWATLTCLQKVLIEPITKCGATCDSVTTAAFASHAGCYVDSGVCDLPLGDLVQIIVTVNTDLFVGPAIQQILGTVGGCLNHYLDEIKAKIQELEDAAKDDFFRAPEYLAQVAVLKGVQNQLQK